MALFQYWSKLCELVGDGADAEQVEVGEVHLRLGVEILVAEVASADDGRRAVGQPQLVVHAPVLLGQVEQAADASRDAGGAAQVQQVEQAHLDVRMGGEHTDLVVPAIAGGVVDEDAYPHATVGCLEQLVGEGARGQSVVDDVVLDVEAALGCANQRRAGDEGILAGAQEVEAGLAGVVASWISACLASQVPSAGSADDGCGGGVLAQPERARRASRRNGRSKDISRGNSNDRLIPVVRILEFSSEERCPA